MTIIWSDFASANLQDVFLYHTEVAGENVARNLRNKIFETTKQLGHHPLSGQVEQSLVCLQEEHRYLVAGNYKIVYKIIEKVVLITDLFDTRQDPVKINDIKRKPGR